MAKAYFKPCKGFHRIIVLGIVASADTPCPVCYIHTAEDPSLASGKVQESSEKKLKSCYNGGTLLLSSCVCPNEYTGESCETSLNDAKSNAGRLRKLIYEPPKHLGMNHYINEVEYENSFRFNIHRRKRQADTGSEGSGESSGASPSCPERQILSGDECIYASAFVFRLTVEGDFLSEYSNLQSSLTQSFIANLTSEIQQALTGTSFISTEITSLQNDSVLVGGNINFEENSALSTIDVNLLLRDRLGRVQRFSNIAAEDQNECNTDDVCGSNTTCTNLDGSFSCACSFGFSDTNSSNSERRRQCESLCKDISCLNGGMCIAGDNNEGFCSCPESHGGFRCEVAVLPWRQATIAVTVILLVILLAITFGIIYYFYRIKDVKHEKPQKQLLGTGFKPASEHDLKTHTNPYPVDDSTQLPDFTFEQERYVNGKYTSKTEIPQLNEVHEDSL